MIYKATRSKIFRSKLEDGRTVKNRVFLTKLKDGGTGIGIKQLCLSDINVDGWEPVKTYQGFTLYSSVIHLRESTLQKVINKLNELYNEYSTDGND